MRRNTGWSVATMIAVASLANLSAACGGESTAPATLSQVDADQIGIAIMTDLEQTMTHLTVGHLGSPYRTIPWLPDRVADRPPSQRLEFDCDSCCPAIQPDPMEDDDGDGVPNREVLTYRPCYRSWDGPTELVVSSDGSFTVADPEPETAGLDMDLSTPAFYVRLSQSGHEFATIRQSGHSVVSGESGGGLVILEQIALALSKTNVHVVDLSNDYHATFVPTTGGQIAEDGLPDGTLAVDGSIEYADGSRTSSFSVATTTPLEYDASCWSTQSNSFRAGVLEATVAGAGPRGHLELTFANCRPPAARFVPTP